MQMTKQTESITQNAVISLLFSDELKGFLYQDRVFIQMDSTSNEPSNIFVYDESANNDVPMALYLSEMVSNSLGLNLKEDKTFDPETIQDKLMEQYNLVVSVSDFDVIPNLGEVVEVELPSSEQEQAEVEVEPENVTSVDTVEEEEEDVTPDFASMLQKSKEVTVPEVTLEVPVFESTETPTVETTEPVTEEEEEPVALSRKEKAEICKEELLGLMVDKSRVYAISDLKPALDRRIEFDISPTSVRNFLTQLSEDGKVETAGRNRYRLPNVEQISIFEEEVIEAPTAEKAVEAEPTETPKAAVQQPAPVVQEEVVQFIPMEQDKPAENFPALFHNDDEVAEYLTLLNVPTAIKDWTISFRQHNRARFLKAPQNVVDLIPEDLRYLKGDTLVKSLSTMKADFGLSLKGPAGTGKTTLVDTLGAVLNLPVFSINGSLESNKASLVGEATIKQKGIISIKDGQMQKAAIHGGLFYIDEINMTRPDVLSIINSLLDDRKSFQNDVRGERTVALPEMRFVSAMNEGYAGTKPMNKATNDRNMAIRMDFLGKQEIVTIFKNVLEQTVEAKTMTSTQKEIMVEKVARLYNILTEKAKNNLVPELAASTRSFIQLIKSAPSFGTGPDHPYDFQLPFEMIMDKFSKEEIDQIKGALVGSDIGKELGIEIIKD